MIEIRNTIQQMSLVPSEDSIGALADVAIALLDRVETLEAWRDRNWPANADTATDHLDYPGGYPHDPTTAGIVGNVKRIAQLQRTIDEKDAEIASLREQLNRALIAAGRSSR